MGGSPPKPDPQMGEAAKMSAETGRQMLDWMKGQATITNNWAAEDRAREVGTFRPLQDQFIAEAQTWDSPSRVSARAAEAGADVAIAGRQAAGQRVRQAMAMGVNPNSGRFQNAEGRAATDLALASAGASNLARRTVRAEGDARRAQAINLGMGLAVNPGTSMGLSNSAGSSGFGGAMSGYGQQAGILNNEYQGRLQSWNAQQNSMSGLFGGIGAVLGATNGFGMFPAAWGPSSKEYKEDKKPVKGALDAARSMPVEQWRYKPGIADGGAEPHIGPYAEDFQQATGVGDGKTIDLMTQMGVTLGAVQELADKVDRIEAKVSGNKKAMAPAMELGVAA